MSDRNERKVICLIGNVLKERYCIVEQIGHGGGGSLYLAKDMELGICRAVKEIPIAKKKEARLMQHLEYPAIPKIIDYVETGEYCYLIMEYIKGQSLGELLRSGKRFSLREILALGKEIARVLEYLHSRKPPVCYGDLKPDNLMFSETGHLYLIDLGSAMFDHGKRKQICEGTKGYAAPEQYQGYLRPGSDIYALGKTLEKLCGKKKWQWFLYPDYFWLLYDGETLVGFVNGMVTDQPDLTDEMYEKADMHNPEGKWQMIFGVNTIPSYRRKGCAAMLIEQAIKDAKAQDREGLVLTCKDKLVHYYAKFGFVNEGVSESVHGGVIWYQMRLRFDGNME